MITRTHRLLAAAEIMRCEGYETVSADQSLSLELLNRGVTIFVLSATKHPIGVISSNICSALLKILTLDKNRRQVNAGDLMQPLSASLAKDSSFAECLELMRREQADILPVVASGHLVGMISSVDLLYHQHEQQQNLLWDHNQLQKELQQKEEYLGVLSHDIRTPLSVISLSCEFLLSPTQLAQSDATISSFIERIQRNCDNAANMVGEILDSLHNEHTQNNVRQEVEVGAFVGQIVQNLQLIAKQKAVSIQVECAKDYRLAIVASQIQHVLENILTNAIKFSPDNATIYVTMSSENIDTEDYLVISVRDEGPGIRNEDRSRIFEKYQQSDQQRKAHGVGLGLFIAKKFVKAHGGWIDVASFEDPGAVFQVRLPGVVIVDDGQDKSNGHNQPVVLMVEDDPDLLEYFAEALRFRDLTVVTAENGERGFQEYLRHKPDIIITDIMMPQVDGLEMLAMIRNHDEHHMVPVILFTGVYPGLFEDLAQAPFQPDHVIQKPATVEELADLIGQYLLDLQKAS
ncbi:MAG: ATP-binding protein [Oligoflexus sp.]